MRDRFLRDWQGLPRRHQPLRSGTARLGLLVGLLALLVAAAGARPAGPKLWLERPASPRAPAADGLAWRSLRLPPAQIVEAGLRQTGQLHLNSDAAEIERAVQQWYHQTAKSFYTGPDPAAWRALQAREKALLDPTGRDFGDDEKLSTPPKSLLGVVVEFRPAGGEETFERHFPVDPQDPSQGCSDQEFTYGALGLGDDPPPLPGDNFTFFKPNISIADYQSAFFGTGPDAGYGVVRPDLGGIDLSGYTLNNYLAEMSHGTYQVGGGFLTEALALPHAHEYYGSAVYDEDEDGNCLANDGSDAHYSDFAFDTVDALIATYGSDASIDWSDYDADDDHIVDLLVIIHAGYAWQNGGGIDRLSTTSTDFTTPQQIAGFDTPDDESDDYFVQSFNVDPEQLDIGSIQEEFEHQFGLPDLYVTDGANSNAWWTAHSSGVWGGTIGGSRPVGHNLWQDWLLGWRHPRVLTYNDPQLLSDGLTFDLGRARYKPAGTDDGVIVRLPNGSFRVDNLAGDGMAWYSQSGDQLDNRVYRAFDLSDADKPLTLSIDSWWDIEEDFDYGLIEFSDDGGETWITLPDEDGVLTDADPNGAGVVSPGEAWGLTGAGQGALTFNISRFAGETLWIRFRYLTDPGVANPGWQIDNIVIADDNGILYQNDLEEDFSDWTNEGWIVIPYTVSYVRYYLLEWRDDNGFDQSLNDAYQSVYANPHEPPPESIVDALPATTPGLQVSYRDGSQDFDYAIADALFEGQSIGAKFGHLVVDSHFWPKRFDTPDANADNHVGILLSGRVQPGDALFGLTETRPWQSRLGYDPATGQSLETKSWPGDPPKPAFHDSYGYYPGLFYVAEADYLDFVDYDASVVLPSTGPYTTRITDPEGNLLTSLFGATVGGFELGTGNPGDSHVHYGLHAEVLQGNDLRATVRLWTRTYELRLSSQTEGVLASGDRLTTTFRIAENIGGKIDNPLIVVKLPAGAHYVAGSGFGGLGPMDATLRGRLRLADGATYLVWQGDDIWTGAVVAPFGLDWTADAGLSHATLEVSVYRDGATPVQTETYEVNAYPYGSFLPLLTR